MEYDDNTANGWRTMVKRRSGGNRWQRLGPAMVSAMVSAIFWGLSGRGSDRHLALGTNVKTFPLDTS